LKILTTLLQYEQQLLAALLLVYHSLIWGEGLVWKEESHLSRFSLLLILYGLFLLWQPLWVKLAHYRLLRIATPLLLFILFSYFYLDEALFFFGLLMTGLIGSRLFSYSTTRGFDLMVISVLIIEMATGIVPQAFPLIYLPPRFLEWMQILTLIPILLLFLAPIPDRSQQTRSQFDLMHGVLSTALIFIVLLGGIVINLLYGVRYTDGLLLSVFIVATLAFGISWFWNPGVGFSGLGVLWNRYTMTIGGPFETWINTLTTLIEQPYITATEFLQAACDHLIDNEWLNGICWSVDGMSITAGRQQGVEFHHRISEQASVLLYFRSDPGKALRQHTLLLIRMAWQFYLFKMNQEKIRAEQHIETIHHTGARLTHDIKNILQSIKASIDILQLEPGKSTGPPMRLLDQNLQQISQRLENTLHKLAAPQLCTRERHLPLSRWLEEFRNEHRDSRIHWQTNPGPDPEVPAELFHSVAGNLISNALAKPDSTRILIDVSADGELILLTVCDNGHAIESEIAEKLFRKPVSSGQGMGIGLYQSAIMAHAHQYELDLVNNENGRVCFSLLQHRSEEITVEMGGDNRSG
jgi:signal transduction histidine kinase